MTRSTRAPTSAIVSPEGHGPVQMDQSVELGSDVGGLPALEGAVVPFHEVRVALCIREPGQRRRVGGARERARQHETEAVAGQPSAQGDGL